MYTTTVVTRKLIRKPVCKGVSYTTGVPAMIGAMMFFKGEWNRPGVNNVEEFNPDPFMEQLNSKVFPGMKSSTKIWNYKEVDLFIKR